MFRMIREAAIDKHHQSAVVDAARDGELSRKSAIVVVKAEVFRIYGAHLESLSAVRS